MILKRSVAVAALAAIALIESSNGSLADTDREKALEARVKALEKTVQLLLQHDKVQPPKSVKQQATVQEPVKPATIVADQQSTPQNNAPPDATKAETSKIDRDKPLPQPGAVAADEPAQELNVLRDNTVTLKPRSFEISTEIDYIQKQTALQRDRAVINNTSIRYGVLDWLELSTTIPIGFTTRTSDLTTNSQIVNHTKGLGDISVQANMRIVDQTETWPGIVISLGFQAPTGQDPYDFDIVRVIQKNQGGVIPNPRNPLFDYYSQGSWVAHSNIQAYKTIDPVILFAGIGVDHVFPYTTTGYQVEAFNRLSYNFGFSLALSEKTTAGFTIAGTYSPKLKVNGQTIFKSEQEPVFARVSIIQRLAKGWYLEPSIAWGLDADAPDFVIGLGTRYRF